MDTTQFTSDFTREIKGAPSRIKELYRSLSPERVILIWVLAFVSIMLLFSALVSFNSRFLVTVPAYGGDITEGIVGTPRFINPVLATNEQDEDLTALVFAGLTKKDASGNAVYDMAESITESDDGLHYDVVLKKSARFHDGTPVTVDDVIYTINLVQNPNIKSPRRVEWEGVTMEKISDTEMTFSLKKEYPQFMDRLALGILPKNIWKNLTDEQFPLSDYNIHAVGSGPYMIDSIKSSSGIPYSFTLRAHEDYTLGRPYIDTITITTYQSEKYMVQAFQNGDISRIHGVSPETTTSLRVADSQIHTSLLPRTFTVFFNTNKSTALSEQKVRQALAMAIDKDAIVKTVLHNYGKVTNAPFPFDEDTATSTYDPIQAKALLEGSKAFKANKGVSITLATANTDEMKATANMIKTYWEAIGVKVTLAVYEVSDINQSVIKDRDFEALLFASITETPADLYAFWHSSQRTYPGLNISGYVSNSLDKNLETLRNGSDPVALDAAYRSVKKEFADEVPSIFLFAPSLIYVSTDKSTTLLPVVSFSNSSRFTLVQDWHRYSERIWPKTYWKQVMQAVENIIH
jgi:peptide/nickel transport system substrate-binding protein